MATHFTSKGVLNDTEDVYTTASAWINLREISTTLYENDSWNVNGISDHGTGLAGFNFDNDMADVNYSFAAYSGHGGGTNDVSVVQMAQSDQGTGSIRFHNMTCINTGTQFSHYVFEELYVIVFGDLA